MSPSFLQGWRLVARMDAGGRPPPTTAPRQPMEYLTFEDSVLDHADQAGNLSAADASRLLADHSFNWEDVHADNHGVSWSHLEDRNAEALLAWLGY